MEKKKVVTKEDLFDTTRFLSNYYQMDDETNSRVDMLIKLGVNKNANEVVREAVKQYVDKKKEDIKKIVDSNLHYKKPSELSSH